MEDGATLNRPRSEQESRSAGSWWAIRFWPECLIDEIARLRGGTGRWNVDLAAMNQSAHIYHEIRQFLVGFSLSSRSSLKTLSPWISRSALHYTDILDQLTCSARSTKITTPTLSPPIRRPHPPHHRPLLPPLSPPHRHLPPHHLSTPPPRQQASHLHHLHPHLPHSHHPRLHPLLCSSHQLGKPSLQHPPHQFHLHHQQDSRTGRVTGPE